jgi:hypothetical protein
MESKLARIAEQALLTAARGLLPAFVEHNRHVQQLYRAGLQQRASVHDAKVRKSA